MLLFTNPYKGCVTESKLGIVYYNLILKLNQCLEGTPQLPLMGIE